jgi:peptidyl-prolyl cis-trans isomerase C
MISANLLYLDALRQGVDQDPDYQRDVQQFTDAILANLYRSKYLVGEIKVTDREIEDFYRTNIVAGTEFTDELRTGIEATIRKQRVMERAATMREQLRKGHKTAIIVTELDPEDDQVRSDDDIVAEIDGASITWAEVRPSMQRAHTLRSSQQRIAALENIIDARIMAQKAREVGLEQDPAFQARYNEFSKTRLINIHRDRLLDSWEPTNEEIGEFYKANEERIIVKEVRKVQMLVVETREEAEDLKKQIEAGEITFHQAVADHSIIPDAKKTLGQIGWVTEGSGFPELDEVTFLLEAGEIGGPVQSPAGWHLVRVLDQRDALYKNIADQQTRNKVRKMLLDEKLNQYVINLRKESFTVDVDAEMINRLSQQEIDWYQEMLGKAQKSPEEVIEEIERLRK